VAFATAADLSAHLGLTLTPGEAERADRLLAYVSSLMLLEMGWAAEPEELDEPRYPLLQLVCLQVAARWWTNPLAIASEVIGDYSYRLDRSQMTGLDFNEAERKLLVRISGHSAITSVRIAGEIDPRDAVQWSEFLAPYWGGYR
jgi:hypothetical protein